MNSKSVSHALILSITLCGCAYNNEQTERKKLDYPAPETKTIEQEVTTEDSLSLPLELKESYADSAHHQTQHTRAAGPTKRKMVAHANKVSAYSMPQASSQKLDAHFIQQENRENYAKTEQNSIKLAADQPVSTFSIDVDTGSYTNVRRLLNQGTLPPVNAVRVEEMINYFSYQYALPLDKTEPFSIHTELATSPWSANKILLKIGLKGYEPQSPRPSANLVFLLDVSGSMNSPRKLPLLKKSLLMLSKQLTAKDKVSIVVYAGASGVVLEPTDGNQTLKIEHALSRLSAGGSTNGQAGIELAYQMAQKAYIQEGINRVILATDGDFNVGTSDVNSLKDLVSQKKKLGISLTTLGFGSGNYNDHLMEQIADVGNGNYAYIDSLNEARKVLVEELDATLMTIAKDVKIQVEFNPKFVQEYRLIGYENRALKREDFNNDKVDAGEIGAGHTVTAIYELALSDSDSSLISPLRYQTKQALQDSFDSARNNELAFIKVRYKHPSENKSQLLTRVITQPASVRNFDQASTDFRFSASVAHFGEALRQSKYLQENNFQKIINDASNAKGDDPFGYRSEFIQLVRLAATLKS